MILSVSGLLVSFLGTLLVAFSVKKGKVEMWKDSSKEREYAAKFELGRLRWGLALLAVGFLLQVGGVFLGRRGC